MDQGFEFSMMVIFIVCFVGMFFALFTGHWIAMGLLFVLAMIAAVNSKYVGGDR